MKVKARDVALWSLGAMLLAFAVALACMTQSTSTHPNEAPASESPNAQALAVPPPALETPPPVASTVPASPPPPSSALPAPPPPAASAPAASRAKPPPQAEKDCKACNGDWGIHGLAQTPSCNCRTRDGGKRCRDGTECQGLCIGADAPERQVVEKGPPARGFFVGRCSKFETVYGCYRPIDDGASARPVDLTELPNMICAD
jgi:hypothetical protein